MVLDILHSISHAAYYETFSMLLDMLNATRHAPWYYICSTALDMVWIIGHGKMVWHVWLSKTQEKDKLARKQAGKQEVLPPSSRPNGYRHGRMDRGYWQRWLSKRCQLFLNKFQILFCSMLTNENENENEKSGKLLWHMVTVYYFPHIPKFLSSPLSSFHPLSCWLMGQEA